MNARRGIFVPPFDELVEPRTLVDLARRAEQRGWDGFFPIDLPDPAAVTTIVEELAELRPTDAGAFDLVVEIAPGDPVEPWAAAGATWVLTDFDSQPRLREVEAAIDAGP